MHKLKLSILAVNLLVFVLANSLLAATPPSSATEASTSTEGNQTELASKPVLAGRAGGVLDKEILEQTHKPGAGEDDTTIGSSWGMLKWGLVGLVILVPLLLLPTLFIFTRKASTPIGDEEQGTKSAGVVPNTSQKPYVLVHLSKSITLEAIEPLKDPYLEDRPIWEKEQELGGPVRDSNLDDGNMAPPHYFLHTHFAIIHSETGQLYHKRSGLVFNRLDGCTFDYANSEIKIKGKLPENMDEGFKVHNLVYDTSSGQIYERCLSIRFHSGSWGPANWSLPDFPRMNGLEEMDSIRRVEPDELPPILGNAYRQLLSDVDSTVRSRSSGSLAPGKENDAQTVYLDTVSQVAFPEKCATASSEAPGNSSSVYLDTNSVYVKA